MGHRLSGGFTLSRRLLVPLLVAALLGVPGLAAAGPEDCPPGVAAVKGVNPSYEDIADLLDGASAVDGDDVVVPPQILKAVAYQESSWRQYDGSGNVVISSDDVCGVGIMQVTAAGDPDPLRLATDIGYNIARGAQILRDKWRLSQSLSDEPADTGLDDDPAVTENWYYALCLYNGSCASGDTYAARVAETVADPFRRVGVAGIKPYMPIKGFTKPAEADPSYVFPGAFQARLDPDVFVFYDNDTGAVTKTVEALTHRYDWPSPVVDYGARAYGPDGPGVTCTTCGAWRLAEGRGLAGRAHWTGSVTGPAQTSLTWTLGLPRSGRYQLKAYVPALGTATLGRATYSVAGTPVTIDQHAYRDQWRDLGVHTLGPAAQVTLTDASSTAGQRLVADSLSFTPVPTLTLTSSASRVAYGSAVTLTARLTHGSAALVGRSVQLYKRPVGQAGWTKVGAYTTGSSGTVSVTARPAANTEYHVQSSHPGYTSAKSTARRVYVVPRVTAALSRASVPRGVAATVSAYVSPSHAGRSVVLQRLVNGSWQPVTSRTLSSTSRASFAVSRPTAGTYYYRVVLTGHTDHATGTSPRLTLTVT